MALHSLYAIASKAHKLFSNVGKPLKTIGKGLIVDDSDGAPYCEHRADEKRHKIGGLGGVSPTSETDRKTHDR
ncbi:hypothetical protein TNCV_2625611 [Trichonephila clavipes]|nr:hypothetical protein TNCV_2625611 [Trichonephila clavipes]